MKTERLATLAAARVTVLSPESTYVDDTVTIEPGCILHPNVFLRGQTVLRQNVTVHQSCEITDSELGQGVVVERSSAINGSSIGRDCRVGPCADITNSQFGTGCRVGHYCLAKYCQVGDTVKVTSHCFLSHAVIEDGVHLSTGLVTANYDGVMKHSVNIRAGAFIGGGTQLIAPLTIGKGAYVGSGSIIREDVPDGALAVSAGKQRNIEGWATKRLQRPPSLTPASEAETGTKKKRTRYYRTQLEAFRALLAREGSEEEYQQFLKTDYWIVGPSYEECSAKQKAGSEYVPDFVMERTDGWFEVVEIKTPTANLFVRVQGRLVESAELKSAVAQLLDYLEYYDVHYLSESKIQSRDFRVVAGRLVIGRTRSSEEHERLRQLNERYHGMSICTFDDLLASATSFVKKVEIENQ